MPPRNNRGFVSIAWQFFDKLQNDTEDGQIIAVSCKLCEKQYKFFGNTSNMRSHLIRAHPLQWDLCNNGTLSDLKTDNEQSESDNENDQELGSNEEWLDEDTGNLATIQFAKKAKRRKLLVKNIKRELVSPGKEIFSYTDSINERSHEIPIKDEFSVFGEYIANKLRQFKQARTRGNIQQLITTILWQAEYGVYDTADSVKKVFMNTLMEPEPQKPHKQ